MLVEHDFHACGRTKAIALAVVLGLSSLVSAEPQQPNSLPDSTVELGETRPWAVGVRDDERNAALELYRQGNAEFKESHITFALAKYEQAIQHWDHPAIRFNMAVCLIQLDRPVEAMTNLEHSLQFGEAALGADAFAQGQVYFKLLEARVSRIDVSCSEFGAEMMLDFKRVLTCPGKAEQVVMPGPHEVTVTKPGYITNTRVLVVAPGQRATQQVAQLPALEGPELQWRWRRWIPPTIAGAGAAFALFGAAMWTAGRTKMDQFEADFADACPAGCEPGLTAPNHAPLRDLRDEANRDHTIGLLSLATGGVVAVTGVALYILNRPLIAPVVVPTREGVAASVGWRF
jgi:hypothetical protein